MKQIGVVVLTLLGACGDGGSAQSDARSADARTMCPAVSTTPLPAGMHQLYLDFEGQTLTKGAADDSANNVSSILMPDTITVPAYQMTNTARQGRIDLIVGYVQRALAPYSLDVATTRPTSGAYHMGVIGGMAASFGYPAGILSLAPATCDMTAGGHIALEFDNDGESAIDFANSILSDFGAMSGLALSTKVDDCMNRTNPNFGGLICTFDAAAPTGAVNCGRGPTQDEPQLLMTAYGCR